MPVSGSKSKQSRFRTRISDHKEYCFSGSWMGGLGSNGIRCEGRQKSKVLGQALLTSGVQSLNDGIAAQRIY